MISWGGVDLENWRVVRKGEVLEGSVGKLFVCAGEFVFSRNVCRP